MHLEIGSQSARALRRERKPLPQKLRQTSQFSWPKMVHAIIPETDIMAMDGIISVSLGLGHNPHCKWRVESASFKAHKLHRLLWKPAPNYIKRKEQMLVRQQGLFQITSTTYQPSIYCSASCFSPLVFCFEIYPFGTQRSSLFLLNEQYSII